MQRQSRYFAECFVIHQSARSRLAHALIEADRRHSGIDIAVRVCRNVAICIMPQIFNSARLMLLLVRRQATSCSGDYIHRSILPRSTFGTLFPLTGAIASIAVSRTQNL